MRALRNPHQGALAQPPSEDAHPRAAPRAPDAATPALRTHAPMLNQAGRLAGPRPETLHPTPLPPPPRPPPPTWK